MTSPTPALIDCGATLNFLHEETIAQLQIDTQPCPPIEVTVVDGRSLPSAIRRQVTLDFEVNNEKYHETFYIAPIGVHAMILGMPWLTNVNPDIDWRARTAKPRLRQDIIPTPLQTPESAVIAEPTMASTEESKKK